MKYPYEDVLEATAYWMVTAFRLGIVVLLLGAAATFVAAAVNRMSNPLLPRHDEPHRSTGPMPALAIVGAAVFVVAVVLICAAAVTDFAFEVRADDTPELLP